MKKVQKITNEDDSFMNITCFASIFNACKVIAAAKSCVHIVAKHLSSSTLYKMIAETMPPGLPESHV
jgi:hypothetical protein